MMRFTRFVGSAILTASLATAAVTVGGSGLGNAAPRCGLGPLAAAPQPNATAGAWVIDLRTGCEWGFAQTTRAYSEASVSKVAILAMTLQRVADGQWRLANVDRLLNAMITRSDNDATQTLWNRLGGQEAVQAFHESLGLSGTTVGATFGSTLSTPHDVAWITAKTIGSDSILPDDLRTYARQKMWSVSDDQDFGVTAGAPIGWTVAVKNGWWQNRPQDRGRAWRWRVNSTGLAFDATGQPRWVLTVLGNDWRSYEDGVAQIEQVASFAHQQLLTAGRPQPSARPGPRRP